MTYRNPGELPDNEDTLPSGRHPLLEEVASTRSIQAIHAQEAAEHAKKASDVANKAHVTSQWVFKLVVVCLIVTLVNTLSNCQSLLTIYRN